MPGISLRDYIREIEKQIDAGRTEEAIAHSRYILESYPKYVEAYRLLGKSFLESQRYGDASDIFQRILSSIPDDFVSHVGMSIIREDEGNLDEAIWHMERAFDVQPSNGAIQEELRRLYGKRDSTEPPRIRLTRGALARMYAKGELYPQAIAEVRAALAETPERADLQALLAEIYAQAGQHAEAVDVGGQVLQRLPFCLAANRVTAEALIASKRDDEAQAYLQRLAQLDPYAAYISPAAPTAESVPDQAIKLDKLDYKPGVAAPGKSDQPTWAASLGVDLGNMATGRESALPDWLSPITPTPAAERLESGPAQPNVPVLGSGMSMPSKSEEPIIPATPNQPDNIPDWMKDLGWGPASEAAQEAEANYRFEEDLDSEAINEDLVSADIPEWLRVMAPEDIQQPDEQASEASPASDDDVSPWLDKLFSANEKAEGAVATFEAAEDLPDWLDAGGPATAGTGTEDIPDWLTSGATPGETAPADNLDWLSGAATAAGISQEDDLDWLQAPAAAPSTQPVTEADWPSDGTETGQPAVEDEIPDWMLGDQPEEIPTPAAPAPSQQPAEELPAWLTGGIEAPETAVEATPAEELPDWLSGEPAQEAEATPANELPDWLMGGIETPQAAATEVTASEATPAEELPDWLSGGQVTDEQAAAPAEGLPDWLRGDQPAEGEPSAAAPETLPAWMLGDIETPEAAGIEAQEPAAEITPDVELPGWLHGTQAIEEEPAAAPSEGLPDWLTGSVETFETTTPKAARTEETPAWLMGAMETPETEAAGPVEAEVSLAAELPDWLRGEQASKEETQSARAEEVPAWLSGGVETFEVPAPESAVTQPAAEATPATELPDWLRGQPGIEVEEELATAPADELAAWLAGDVAAPEAEAAVTPAAELPDWLRGEQSVEEEPEAEAAAAPAEELPAWLVGSLETPEAEAAELAEAVITPAAELPDWLRGEQVVEEETEAAPAEELPAWLAGSLETPEAEVAELAEAELTPAAELPDWLRGEQVVEEETEAAPAEELPAWLAGSLETPEAEAAELAEAEVTPAAELPDWLREEETEAAPAEERPAWLAGSLETPEAESAELAEAVITPAAELPDWLRGEQVVEEEPEAEAEAAPAEGLPEWLQEPAARVEQPQAQPEEELPAWLREQEEELPAAVRAEEVPSWIEPAEEMVEPSAVEPLAEQPAFIEPEEDLDNAFAWLDSLLEPVATQPIEPAAAPVVESFPIEPPTPPAPVQPVAAQPKPQPVSPPPAQPAPAPAASSAMMDEDAAFAWLEALAVKQGANEALLLKPEERVEKPPEWVQRAAEEQAEEQYTNVQMASEAVQALDVSQPEAVEPPETPPAAAQPAQVQPTPEPPAKGQPPKAEPAVSMLGDEDAAFAWLEALAVKQGANEALLLKPEERVEKPPEWVQRATEEQAEEQYTNVQMASEAVQALDVSQPEAVEPPVAAEPPQAPAASLETPPTAKPAAVEPVKAEPASSVMGDEDAAFAWLESLAVRQGANEALLLKPEERTDIPPDWVMKQTAEGEELAAPQHMEAPEEMARMVGAEGVTLPATDKQPLQEAEPPEAPAAAYPVQPAKTAPTPPSAALPPQAPTKPPLVTRPAHVEPPDWVKAQPEAAEEAKPKKKRDTGGLPPLPDWLTAATGGESSEALEWTPPPVTKRKYDLNRASLGELERLPGVGFIMAQRIINYRDQHGAFKSVDELLNVPDFSPLTLEDIRDNLFVIAKVEKPAPISIPRPAPTPVVLPVEEGLSAGLVAARNHLGQGDIAKALDQYNHLIANDQALPTVIEDLKEAAEKHPREFFLWQYLGDAYLRLNQVGEAIQAYAKAEQILR